MFPRSCLATLSLLNILFSAASGAGAEATRLVKPGGWRVLGAEELRAGVAPGSALQAHIDSLETSVTRGDSQAFDSFLKADLLIDAIVRPVHLQQGIRTPEIESAFVQGTRASWANRSLSSDYLGHQFRFLRVHTLAGRPGLLFRSAGEKGQLNYCHFSMGQSPDGTYGADDIYVVGMGEWLSDTLRRGYLTLVESLNPRGESGRRAGLYVNALPHITAMQTALIRKQYAKVLELSSTLPSEVLQDRQILLTRLEAAENVSFPERRRVFEQWMSLYPNADQLPLKWADYHLAAGDFEEARSVLSSLNERLGGDTYLMLRLGEIKMLAAHQAAGRLLGGRPGLEAGAADRAESVR